MKSENIVDSLQSAVGSQQSAVGSRQSAVGSRQKKNSRKVTKVSNDFKLVFQIKTANCRLPAAD